MKKKILSLTIVGAMAAALLAGCGSSDSGSGDVTTDNGEDKTVSDTGAEEATETEAAASTGATDAHLDFSCYNYSNSMDPINNVNSSWCGVRYGVTECLFTFDENVNVEYSICDDAQTDDYQTWTLHIRDDVTFSNGTALTPSIVKDNFDRAYEAEENQTGNSTPSQYVTFDSIEADDDAGTLTLVCSEPQVNLEGILAYPFFAIVDTNVIDSEVIGTGPYYVTDIQEDTTVDLARNTYYWNGDVPYETITIYLTDDSSTKAMALMSGDVQLAENITTPSDLDQLEADSTYYVSTTAGVRMGNAYFNYNGVFANDDLRKAVLMAIDDDTLCDVTVGGLYTAGYSVLPSSLDYGYDQLTDATPYDIDQATQILDDAGIVDTDGDGYRELDGEMIDINYVTFTSRNLDEFAQAIAITLESIGLKCTVDVQDYDTALANQTDGNFDLISSNALTVPTGDPTGMLGNWYSGNSDAYGYYSNADYDADYEQLLASTDENERAELIVDMQQILIDDCATLVHGYYNSTMASIAADVAGADIVPMDYYWITTAIHPAS